MVDGAKLAIQQPHARTVSAEGHVREDACRLSLVQGGPLYQLYLRVKLTKPPLELVRRRMIILCLICWFPLLLLSLVGRAAFGGVALPLVYDLGAHVRFLVALPLLIEAEVIAWDRIPGIVQQFVERKIIALEDQSRFASLVASANRLRSSTIIEVLLLLLAIGSYWMWRQNLPFAGSTWYLAKTRSGAHLTAAGCYYAFVSLPILRFLILRWYFCLFVWYWFLWHLRGFPLHLNALHPDRAGGLGFLSRSVFAFAPMLLAQTIMLAGVVGNEIWHAGLSLPMFKMGIVGVLVFLMLLVLLPLTFFMGPLIKVGRKGREEYGVLASRYVEDFYRKWLIETKTQGAPLLGTPDIQSLADLGNAHAVVSQMRIVPINKDIIIRLALILILPLLPLLLTMIKLEQVMDRLFKIMV